jgi:oligopeptide transport system substrate-binding protein
VRALDDLTLLVELEEPVAYFLYLVTYRVAYPVPRHRVQALGETWAETNNLVTNGPFVVEAWQPDESVMLVRNPNYHGRFRGNLQRVELILCSDPQDALALYEADELDVLDLWQIPLADRDRVRQRHAGEYRSGTVPVSFYLGFNTGRPPFDDVRVRRALALSIDRDALVRAAGGGVNSRPATGGLVPPGLPGHSQGIALPHDPEQARQLLATAGFPHGRGFPAVDALGWIADELGEILQDHWRKNLGLEIKWQQVGLERFMDRLDRDPPHLFETAWWADYPDPDNFLRGALLWQAMGRRDKTFDALVKRARCSADQQERMRLYRQADRILIDEVRLVPTDYGCYHNLLKPWVKRYPVSAMGFTSSKDVVIEPH